MSNELEQAKEQLASAQQQLTGAVTEARELRKQHRLAQPRLDSLRREHAVLLEHTSAVADGRADHLV